MLSFAEETAAINSIAEAERQKLNSPPLMIIVDGADAGLSAGFGGC